MLGTEVHSDECFSSAFLDVLLEARNALMDK